MRRHNSVLAAILNISCNPRAIKIIHFQLLECSSFCIIPKRSNTLRVTEGQECF